jgi:hypothetical protein
LMCRVEVLLGCETPRYVAQDAPRIDLEGPGRVKYRPDRSKRPRGQGKG